MTLDTSLVDIDSIQFNQDLIPLDPALLEYSANTIATVGDLLHVPIVRFLGVGSYELLSNFEEYQAFLKARELNPNIPDRVRVFVARKKNESAILEQIEILRQIQSSGIVSESNKSLEQESIAMTSSNFDIELRNIKANMDRLSAQMEISTTNQGNIQNTLSELVEAQPKPLPILEAFNQIDRSEIHQRLAVAIAQSSGFTSAEKKKIEKVIERVQFLKAQEPDLEFATLNDFLEKLGHEKVKGRKLRYLTEKSLLKLIDQWPL